MIFDVSDVHVEWAINSAQWKKAEKRSCHRNYINNEQTFDLKAFKHISYVMRY